MQQIAKATVQLFVVVQIFVFAGVASAQMKVACVGDSITALPSGWCGYLGTKLGSGYTAQTFGVSGTTLLKNVGQPAYSSSNQYKPSHDFAPNIVVIMLGTNDSMPRNWSAGKDHFVKDYEELIDSYTSLATKPLVILNTAPPASNDNMFTISGMTIEKEVNPLIKQVAMNKGCPLADVWAALGGDVTKLGSADGVHPGASGSMLIADCVAKTIMSPVVPGASAGGMGGGGTGGNINGAGHGGAGRSALASGVGGSVTTSGVGGGTTNPGGASGGKAGGSANSAASGGSGSTTNPGGNTSSAGAGSRVNAGGNSSIVNGIGAAGTSAPVAPAAESGGCGCQMTGNSTSHGGATAALLLILGIAIRSRKRASAATRRGGSSMSAPVHVKSRSAAQAIVQLSIVALVLISAGVASAQKTKVACVGDSITALPSSWCGDLSTKLGASYTVSNFGVSGTNLAKNVAQPYWSSAQYTPSHTFAPNIVIIMLGTNDAIPNTWAGGKSHFLKDYEELIDTYTSLASKPSIYMIIPTPIGTSPFGHSGDLLATEVIPVIKQVAVNKMVPTIDAFTAFGGTMFDAGLYGAMDQVHPNAKGQQIICDAVYAVLMSTGGLGGAGTGASAGSGGSANANAGVGGAGSSVNTRSAGTGGGSANAGVGTKAGSGAGTGGVSASVGMGANAGSSANKPGSASLAGSGGSANVGTNTGNAVNAVASAGSNAPVPSAAESGGCGCRMAGNSASQGGPAAVLLLLLGIVTRGRKKKR